MGRELNNMADEWEAEVGRKRGRWRGRGGGGESHSGFLEAE